MFLPQQILKIKLNINSANIYICLPGSSLLRLLLRLIPRACRKQEVLAKSSLKPLCPRDRHVILHFKTRENTQETVGMLALCEPRNAFFQL